MSQRADVLIVGGGLAGAAAAAALASAGRDTVVIEREAGPHDKVCGEFLSWEAQLYLARLGLDPVALGAVPIETVRLVSGDHLAEMKLPFRALSLSRRVLDEAILQLASEKGAILRRGKRVIELDTDATAARARLDDGETVDASTAFLATGKHDLRGLRRPAGSQSDLIAFKQYFTLRPDQAASLDGVVELVLFEGGYVGLEPVEGGVANLSLVVRRQRFTGIGQSWSDLFATLLREAPHLARRLEGATPMMPRPLAVSTIPYGYVRKRADLVWRLGDQAAVIPSFAGDGMSIALHSASLAAACYLAGGTADAYQRRLARDVANPVRIATALSQLLVRRAPQGMLISAALLRPGLMSIIAGATRLTDRALTEAWS